MTPSPLDQKILSSISVLQNRWMMRDRIIVVCAADYTDLALGLGETTFMMSVLACSSANVANAHSKAASMGHAAEGMKVEGVCSEDFNRLLGMVGRAWSKKRNWEYRNVDVFAGVEGEVQLGIFLAKGDIKKSKKDLSVATADIKRLISMYGVESSDSSKTMGIVVESISLSNPLKHPELWAWLSKCASL